MPVEVAPEAEALLAVLLRDRPAGRIVHLRGTQSRGRIAERLREAGLTCDEAITYRQDARPLTAEAATLLAGPAPVVAPLASPRTAALLADLGPFAAPLCVVALSVAVAEAAGPLMPVSLTVAARPDGPALVAATLAAFTLCGAGSAVLEGPGQPV